MEENKDEEIVKGQEEETAEETSEENAEEEHRLEALEWYKTIQYDLHG